MRVRISIEGRQGSPRKVELGAGVYGIGRDNDDGKPGFILIEDETVSSHHGELTVQEGRVTYRDLDSTNGSRDGNGQAIIGPYELSAASSLRLGEVVLTLVSIESTAVARGGTKMMPSVPAPQWVEPPTTAATGASSATPSVPKEPPTVRGKIIKVPDATEGLLVVGDQQYEFTLKGLWRSAVAPAVNQTVDVVLDSDGTVRSLTLVDATKIAKEQLRVLGARAQNKAASAVGEAKRRANELPPQSRKTLLKVAAGVAVLLFGLVVWSAVGSVSGRDPLSARLKHMNDFSTQIGSYSSCDQIQSVFEDFKEFDDQQRQSLSREEYVNLKSKIQKEYPGRIRDVQSRLEVASRQCPFLSAMMIQEGGRRAVAVTTTRGGIDSSDAGAAVVAGAFGALGLFFVVAIVAGLISLCFWVWMLIDVLAFQSEDKIVWLLVVFFFNFLGSVLYYFLGRKKRIERKALPAA